MSECVDMAVPPYCKLQSVNTYDYRKLPLNKNKEYPANEHEKVDLCSYAQRNKRLQRRGNLIQKTAGVLLPLHGQHFERQSRRRV